MRKRPSFKPLLTPDGWMISIPESMSGTGKRKKRYFELEKDAGKVAGMLRTVRRRYRSRQPCSMADQ